MQAPGPPLLIIRDGVSGLRLPQQADWSSALYWSPGLKDKEENTYKQLAYRIH